MENMVASKGIKTLLGIRYHLQLKCKIKGEKKGKRRNFCAPGMRFGCCMGAIFVEESFCIKKISDSCLRAGGGGGIITKQSEKSESQLQSETSVCRVGELLIEASRPPYGTD